MTIKRKRKKKEIDALFFKCYQLAGNILLMDQPGDLTTGQRRRLTELLLDVLSQPDNFTPETVEIKHQLALEP